MSKTVQTLTTLSVVIATSPLGDSGESARQAVENTLKQHLCLCPQAYSIKVELVSEKDEVVAISREPQIQVEEEPEEPVIISNC